LRNLLDLLPEDEHKQWWEELNDVVAEAPLRAPIPQLVKSSGSARVMSRSSSGIGGSGFTPPNLAKSRPVSRRWERLFDQACQLHTFGARGATGL
jgi:hypothetical protein